MWLSVSFSRLLGCCLPLPARETSTNRPQRRQLSSRFVEWSRRNCLIKNAVPRMSLFLVWLRLISLRMKTYSLGCVTLISQQLSFAKTIKNYLFFHSSVPPILSPGLYSRRAVLILIDLTYRHTMARMIIP